MHLYEKLAAFCLLLVVLGFAFLLVLGAVSYAEPVIVEHVVTGDADLSFLTEAEKSHMDDVHNLARNGVSIMILAVLFLFLYSVRKPITKSLARQGFIMSLVLIALLIPFNYTFIWFHGVFFPQGNWAFPVDSWLITHFPPTAFIVLAVWWFGSTAVLLGLLTRSLRKDG